MIFGPNIFGYFFFKKSKLFEIEQWYSLSSFNEQVIFSKFKFIISIWNMNFGSNFNVMLKTKSTFSGEKLHIFETTLTILKLLMFERMMLWNHYFHENQHVKNLQVRGLISSSARNFNHCFRFGEFGDEKWKSTRRKRLHLLDVVSDLEIISNEKSFVSAFALIASVSATVSAHKSTSIPCASFQIGRGELIATVVYHQSVSSSLWM